MSSFRPTRSSPPSKLTTLTDSLLNSTLSADLSRSSNLSIRELVGLTQDEVDLLDSIIARAGPSATTFPAIFTAYSAVLKERGIDEPSEVVFYGKLLELGTLKGGNWGEKWNMVKLQQGYLATAPRVGAARPTKRAPARGHRVPLTRTRPHDVESTTLHSHANEDSKLGSEHQTSFNVPQYHLLAPVRRRGSPVHSERTYTSMDDSLKYPLLASASASRPLPPLRGRDTDTSEATENVRAPSTTPPSYRAAVRDSAPRMLPPSSSSSSAGKRPTSASLATARRLVAQARERKGSVANEDEAWKKIKMLQDEKHADRFREDRLVEKCWEVWKQGFQWIITTNEQIGEARDHLVLRQCFNRWRTRVAASRELLGRVADLASRRRLEVAFVLWKTRRKERAQAKWRASMRSKMKMTRDKQELRLMKNALQKWNQTHRTRVAVRYHARSVVLRYFSRWKRKLAHLDHLEDIADGLSRVFEVGNTERYWYHWKHNSQLQVAHRIVTENIGLRIKTQVMDVWRRQMEENHIADSYHDIILKKGVLRSWKAARDRIRAMENRAVRHAVIKDHSLLHSRYIVWRSRYRGRQLEGITNLRRLKEAWAVWRSRLQQHRNSADAALTFSLRLNSPLAAASLRKWYRVHSNHKTCESFAQLHYSTCVRRRILLAWRIEMRRRHKTMSHARAVNKFLVMRSAWAKLRTSFAERQRQRTLRAIELRRAHTLFYAWFKRAHRQRAQRLAEESIRGRVVKRILRSALTAWMNRTIEVKNRELQATIDRDAWLVTMAFKRWKGARSRHVEEISLMESYQFVKREEIIRKIFHRWLSAARTAHHRRLTLERKEKELKFGLTSIAWDKWRERFKHKRLQPIEYDVILRGHHNTMVRAFALWHSKTKSLPAIRFNAARIKARCWKIWVEALPRAMQTKTAREVEKKAVLTKFLDKWLQACRTKIALKAVARARYLRLPPPPTRSVPVKPRPLPLPTSTPAIRRSMFPRRTVRTEEPDSESEDDKEAAGPTWRRAGPRSLRSDPSPPRQARSRFSIPATRASSPARSSFGVRLTRDVNAAARPASSVGGERRGRLLHELYQLQRRSGSPSERSRTREPP